MATFGKTFFKSKINWAGILVMGEAAFQFMLGYQLSDLTDWWAVGRFALGLAIVVLRTRFTSEKVNL